MNIEDLRMKLQTLFAGQTKPLIVLAEPEYKPDVSDAGTILEQDPPAGTKLSEPVTVQLVVSRGPNYENTKAPYLIGQSVNDLLQTITRLLLTKRQVLLLTSRHSIVNMFLIIPVYLWKWHYRTENTTTISMESILKN